MRLRPNTGRQVAALLLSLAGSAWAAPACRPATEFMPRLCPAGLPAVRQVHIERNAAASTPDAPTFSDCARFRMTPHLVRRYLRQAWRVSDDAAEHAVDRGPCEASGTLRFADGRRARWRIEQVGTATLVIGKQAPVILACPDCRFAPFGR